MRSGQVSAGWDVLATRRTVVRGEPWLEPAATAEAEVAQQGQDHQDDDDDPDQVHQILLSLAL